jgi:hypothetical protein
MELDCSGIPVFFGFWRPKKQRYGQGFATFGKVTKGMDVVKIQLFAPMDNQNIIPPVSILSIIRK